MKTIVDTSVWSLALRRQSALKNREALVLKRLIEDDEEIYLLGIILQERDCLLNCVNYNSLS